tara:strand:- start:97 stop:819 length:723 start_codon:yes stop_codon:yes gene_type:complete
MAEEVVPAETVDNGNSTGGATSGGSSTVTTSDYSDNLFAGNQKIIFHHKWSNSSIEFKAFDISYSESITNDWQEVALPRRINRSYTWSGVIRSIALGWSMPAFDLTEAKSNMAKCTKLVQMMYPMTDGNTKQIIGGGNPIWHLGIMNWAHAEGSQFATDDASTLLAGFPGSFSWNIVPEDGFLYSDGGQSAFPKNIKASMGYTVLLDDSKNFGYSDKGKWDGPEHFPWYGGSSDDGGTLG